MIVAGGGELHGTAVESYGDHRLAMAMAVASVVAEGETSIADAACADVSYPSFWAHLEQLAQAEAVGSATRDTRGRDWRGSGWPDLRPHAPTKQRRRDRCLKPPTMLAGACAPTLWMALSSIEASRCYSTPIPLYGAISICMPCTCKPSTLVRSSAERGRQTVLSDPTRSANVRDVLATVTTRAVSFSDKLRVARLVLSLYGASGDQRAEPDRIATMDFLRTEGFSERIIQRFLSPILCRNLSRSQPRNQHGSVSLLYADATVRARDDSSGRYWSDYPATRRTAQRSRCDSLYTPVMALVREGDRVTGVQTADGETLWPMR